MRESSSKLKTTQTTENCLTKNAHKKYLESITSLMFMDSFRLLFRLLPNANIQWIGRTRSPGLKGVGYLSFLIRSEEREKEEEPNGFFVTAYDANMRTRECLGNTRKWNKKLEKNKINTVLHKAATTSRLTGGEFLEIPITNYTVTYLYKDRKNRFIRGWHAILKDALYLPDVFLENTYDNGKWMKNTEKEWPIIPRRGRFKLRYTFKNYDNEWMYI